MCPCLLPEEGAGFWFFFEILMYVCMYVCIYLAALGLHCGARASHCGGFSLLWSMGSRRAGSVVVAQGL